MTTRVCIESLAADTRTINSRPLASAENLTGNTATTTLTSAHSRENIFDNSEMVKSFPDVKSDILLDYDINGTRSGATTPLSVTYTSTGSQKDEPKSLKLLHHPHLAGKSATMKKKPKGILKHNSICVDVVDNAINLPQEYKLYIFVPLLIFKNFLRLFVLNF